MKIFDEIRGNYRKYILMLLDIVCFCAVDGLFYLLSAFGNHSHSAAVSDPAMFLKNSAIILLMVLVFRTFFGIYHMVWRYTR